MFLKKLSCSNCQYQECYDADGEIAFDCDVNQCGNCHNTLNCCCTCEQDEEDKIRSVVYQVLKQEGLLR